MNTKLTKKEFDSLYDKDISHKQYNVIVEKIDIRISNILQSICTKFSWWGYADTNYDAECEGGDFDISRDKDEIQIEGELNLPDYLCGSIPTRWLWEDFEQENIIQKEKFKELISVKKLQDKEKRQNRKSYLIQMKNQISTKLSKEELKCITFKK